MNAMDPESTGQRIARARRRRGLSQAALAGLAGRSESWLSQVERGRRGVDSHAVLTRLAAALRVPVADLTGTPDGSAEDAGSTAAAIEQAMMSYQVTGEPGGDHGLRYLQAAAAACYASYQATRYQQAAVRVAELIGQAESLTPTPAAWQLRSVVYDTAAAVLSRTGHKPLAWMAADRAMTAAAQSGDPLRAAAAAFRMSYVLTGRGHPAAGLDLAVAALEQTAGPPGSPSPEQVSIRGALHLAAATAAAAAYDPAVTRGHLGDAARAAGELGADANHLGTAFGPVNVAIHRMSCALRLGDPQTAITTGESLDSRPLPSGMTGRRTQLHLDLARGYALRRQDAAAVNMLLAAEKLSPQLVRYDPDTSELLIGLLRREHRPSTPELRPLARRAGVI
jgi:transcriptional regulator with XRE-family HTH domain